MTRRNVLALVLLAWFSSADAAETPEGVEFFEEKVRPVLVEHCSKCHGGEKVRGNLRLDSRASLLKGGDSGPAIVPGHPEKSRLLKAVSYTDEVLRMPPKGKLADGVLADLTAWIKMGAPWPEKVAGKPGAGAGDAFDLKKRLQHWAWQPLRHATPP